MSKEQERKLWVWSEGGEIFCLEDGDSEPYSLDTSIYDPDAEDYINAEMENLKEAGYNIMVKFPDYLSEDWRLSKQVQEEEKERLEEQYDIDTGD